MRNYGIICETNPMHSGHKYLIDRAREMGADRIVAVMSGNTVQRGEFAILDKYTRAEALLKCGADLVLELPFPWCASSAEHFAGAGIEILERFCDTVIFGSESGDIDLLERAAICASGEAFREKYKDGLLDGKPAAELYFDMIQNAVGRELSSNDLLGIEYIRAARECGYDLSFKTVARKGDRYLDREIKDGEHTSATAIRELWRRGQMIDTKAYIPETAFDVYAEAVHGGQMTSDEALDAFWLSFFRLHNGEDFDGIVGADGGLGNRFCEMAKKARSTKELFDLVGTKRYTSASLKRTMLYCLAGVKKEDIDESLRETLLLAANKEGRALLSEKRKTVGSFVVTKPADADMTLRQNILSERIDAVFTLASENKNEADAMKKKRPYIG